MHSYRMHIRHQLLPQDYARRMQFAQWLVDRCARNDEFLRPFVIGDEAGFAMNGEVNTQNVREYAPAHQPPEFNFDLKIDRLDRTLWQRSDNRAIFLQQKYRWLDLSRNDQQRRDTST